MKAIIFFIFFTIVTIPTVFGQIKIGDNPQNIDASSVLELESTSKVLVITRVTTLEMEAITPQRGGMVYNTDTECINYYDGTQWVNLCDAVNFAITNDPIINGRSTIEITESADGYNLEVAKNSILGDNIVDGGIGPDDIQDNSITQDKLAAESVGSSEIRQNAVGSEEIRDSSIAPADIANFIAGQVLTTDENGIVQWEDSNDLFDLTFNKLDTTLTIARSTTAGVSTISLGALVGSDDQQLDLTDNILSIENDPNTIDLSTYFQTLSINPATNQITLSNGNTINLPAAAVEADGIVGNEILNATDETLVRYGGGTDTNPYTLDVNAGGIDTEELANNAVTNIKLADNSVRTANILNGTISTLDIAPAAAEPANTQILSTSTTGVVGWIDIPEGTAEVDGDIRNELQNLNFNPVTNVLTISTPLTTGNVVNLSALANGGTLNDGQIFVGNNTNTPTGVAVGGDLTMNNIGQFTIEDEAVTPIKIEPALGVLTEDQVLITNNITGAVEWADFPPGGGGGTDNQNASEVAFAPIGNTISTDVQNAIAELQTEIDGITVAGGETNTASNQGIAGVPTFIQKNGADLEFRSVNAGSNKVTVIEDAINNEILVNINDTNLTITESQISDLTHTINTDNQIASAVPFTAVGNTVSTDVQAAIVEIQSEIDGITLSGEINTASNQGVAGVPTFIQKNGADLQFRSVNAGSNKITVTEDAVNKEILVDINDTNLTITESQISDLTHTINTDNQIASAVPFTAVGNTTSSDVQAAIVEIQTEIDNLNVGDNLSNSNLTQTVGQNRTYEIGENDALVFTGLGSVGFGNGANPPLSKFHFAAEIRVEGVNSADGTVGSPAYTFSGDTNNDTGMYRPAADEIGFSVGGIEALRIEEDADETNVIIYQSLQLNNLLLDKDGDSGTAGQILSSTGTQTDWINAPIAGTTYTGGNGITISAADAIDISPLGVNTAELAENAVTTAKILDDNVTPAKIEAGSSGQVLTTNAAGDVTWSNTSNVATLPMGKVNADGTPAKILNSSVIRNSAGNYTVTFTTPRPDDNYIVQLTIFNASPDFKIQLQNQTVNGFTVSITETSVFSFPEEPFIEVENSTENGVTDHGHTATSTPILIPQYLIQETDSRWFFTISDFQ